MGSRYQNIQVSNCDRMASSRLLVAAALVACATAQSNFICPEKDGYFEDTKQCDKYYDCYDGIPEERLCPDGLVFDPFSRKREPCDHYFNVDSGLTSTAESATGQRPLTEANARPRLMLLRLLTDFSVHPTPQLMSLDSSTLTPSTLTPTTAPSSTFV